MQAEYKGFLRMFVPYRSQSKKHSEIYDVVFGLPVMAYPILYERPLLVYIDFENGT